MDKETTAYLVEQWKLRDIKAYEQLEDISYLHIYFRAYSFVRDDVYAEQITRQVLKAVYESVAILKSEDLYIQWIDQMTHRMSYALLNSFVDRRMKWKEKKYVQGDLDTYSYVLGDC